MRTLNTLTRYHYRPYWHHVRILLLGWISRAISRQVFTLIRSISVRFRYFDRWVSPKPFSFPLCLATMAIRARIGTLDGLCKRLPKSPKRLKAKNYQSMKTKSISWCKNLDFLWLCIHHLRPSLCYWRPPLPHRRKLRLDRGAGKRGGFPASLEVGWDWRAFMMLHHGWFP